MNVSADIWIEFVRYNILYCIAQNQFQQCKTKIQSCWNNSTSLLSLTFHSSLESQFASALGRNCMTVSNFVGRLKKVEMCLLAKFGRNQSNRGHDTAIFRFFDFSRMAAVRHLGLVVSDWTTHEGRLVVFITVHNWVGIDAVFSIICKFLQRAAMLALQALY